MNSEDYNILALLDEREGICQRLLDLFESIDQYYLEVVEETERLNEVYESVSKLVDIISALRAKIFDEQKNVIELHRYLLKIDEVFLDQCRKFENEIAEIEAEEATLSPQLEEALDYIQRLTGGLY